MRQLVPFHELPVNTTFSRNGNLWRKRSTRTAEIVKPDCHAGVWFYFCQSDYCEVGRHSRLGKFYFIED